MTDLNHAKLTDVVNVNVFTCGKEKTLSYTLEKLGFRQCDLDNPNNDLSVEIDSAVSELVYELVDANWATVPSSIEVDDIKGDTLICFSLYFGQDFAKKETKTASDWADLSAEEFDGIDLSLSMQDEILHDAMVGWRNEATDYEWSMPATADTATANA